MAKTYEEMFNEIYADYRRLAKATNQRMLRLERGVESGKMPGGILYAGFAYGIAQGHLRDLRNTKADNLRFRENYKPKTEEDFRKAIKDIQAQKGAIEIFMNSASSTWGKAKNSRGETIKGYKKVLQEQTEAINKLKEKGGYDRSIYAFTQEDREAFFKSKAFQQLRANYDSEQVVQIGRYVYKMKAENKDLHDAVEEFNKRFKQVENQDFESLELNLGDYAMDKLLEGVEDPEIKAILKKEKKKGLTIEDFFNKDIR